MNESRLVDVTRAEAARFTDDPTFYDECSPSGEPNPDYNTDLPSA